MLKPKGDNQKMLDLESPSIVENGNRNCAAGKSRSRQKQKRWIPVQNPTFDAIAVQQISLCCN
jgi:hypothetical protein